MYSLAKLTEREKFTGSMGTYYIICYTVVSVSSGNKMFRFSWMGGRHSDARGNTYQEIDLARNTGANFGRLCHDRDYLLVLYNWIAIPVNSKSHLTSEEKKRSITRGTELAPYSGQQQVTWTYVEW